MTYRVSGIDANGREICRGEYITERHARARVLSVRTWPGVDIVEISEQFVSGVTRSIEVHRDGRVVVVETHPPGSVYLSDTPGGIGPYTFFEDSRRAAPITAVEDSKP